MEGGGYVTAFYVVRLNTIIVFSNNCLSHIYVFYTSVELTMGVYPHWIRLLVTWVG